MTSVPSASTDQIKPFWIGVSGGSASGKTSVVKEVSNILKTFPICKISLDSYYKDLSEEDYLNLTEYNFDQPEAFDFDLLLSHIASLRNGESIEMPWYDFVTSKRLKETLTVSSSPVIIFEGILAFYDKRIRNLMDWKIFIDTDPDVRLSRRIFRDITERGRELKTVIFRYHTFVKPAYDSFIGPTKRFADIIIPRGSSNHEAIKMVSEYWKLQLNKIWKGDVHQLFSSINEVIDPKYQFYDNKIIVQEDQSQIEFLKQLFEDVITNEENTQLCKVIRKKLVSMLFILLIKYLHKKEYYSENLPTIDLILTEFDSVKDINFKDYKNILYFKTVILTEEDLKVPELIIKENHYCHWVVNSVFLAPKFIETLLGSKLNTVLLNTLYFSDFFIKFEKLIIKDQNVFNEEIWSGLFKEKLRNVFSK